MPITNERPKGSAGLISRCVQITDSHIAADRAFSLHGHTTCDALGRVLDAIAALPEPPDCVIHTGDVSHDRSLDSYRLIRDLVRDYPIPIYYVNGNHDDVHLLHSELGTPVRSYADKAMSADYRFTAGRQEFIALDSWHPELRDPLGFLSEDQLVWIEDQLRGLAERRGRAILCIHHVTLPVGSSWLDANMVITNGEALHALLVRYQHTIAAVIHGHLHRGMSIIRDGITYASAPSIVWQYRWEPWRSRPSADPDAPPMLTYIDCYEDRVQLSWYVV